MQFLPLYLYSPNVALIIGYRPDRFGLIELFGLQTPLECTSHPVCIEMTPTRISSSMESGIFHWIRVKWITI